MTLDAVLYSPLIVTHEIPFSKKEIVDCQADFDVDNVQRRELVNFYGV